MYEKKRMTFPKNLRLLTFKNFNTVFKNIYKIFYTSQIKVFIRISKLQYPRIGIKIYKKHVKYAHDRNKIKRIIRESFRMFQHSLPKMDFVILSKKNILSFNNIILKKELKKLWCHISHIFLS